MMKVAVVGTGYVGLVTGTCFASLGHDVTCVDIDADKVARMRAGEVPIYEPELDELFAKTVQADRLHFTTELAEAVDGAAAIFLALPTPPGGDGSADLSYVLGVAEKLGPLLKEYAVIVDKSTVPVGTSEKVHEKIAALTKVPFDVVSNPEFLREGVALKDFMEPDRVVVGTSSDRARKVMQDLYAGIATDERPLLFMDERSAELTKYAANSFLATKITFMNEIANLCEQTGANVDSVRIGIGKDPRIGDRFLYPGIGYGGSCFPKDVLALNHTAERHGYNFNLLKAVISTNSLQQHRLSEKVFQYYDDDVSGKTFALWGLAFKPDTDDIREAPAQQIINDLTTAGATVIAYDPEAIENTKRVYADNRRVRFAASPEECLKGADALLIATEWQVFRNISPDTIKSGLKAPVVFDGRNIYDLDAMRQVGFYYESIGREVVQPTKPAADK